MKKAMIIIGIFLLSVALVSPNGDHQTEVEEGKKLVENKISCDKLNDKQLEAIGEYLMEQMHPGEAHDAMHKTMGIQEGTAYHKQFHVNLAQMMYCGNGNMMGGMMGSGGMMPMISMMMGSNQGYGMMGSNYGMMGYGFGYWNFLNVLYVLLIIGLIVLVYLGIIKLWRGIYGKGKQDR